MRPRSLVEVVERARGVSPVSFRTRLIFTGPDPLQRARFPYHRGVIAMPLDHPPDGAGR